MMSLNDMNFPLNFAFIVSDTFGYAISSFSLNSMKSLTSFFISFLIKVSLSREFFSFYEYVCFLVLLLFVLFVVVLFCFLLLLFSLLKFSFSPLWSDRMDGIILIFFYLLRLLLCLITWSILEKVLWSAEKNVYIFCMG